MGFLKNDNVAIVVGSLCLQALSDSERDESQTQNTQTFCTLFILFLSSPLPRSPPKAPSQAAASLYDPFAFAGPFLCYIEVMAPTGSKKGASGGSTKSGMALKRVKGENFYRDAKAAARIKMINGGKAVRDRDGKIVKAAVFQAGEAETKPGRVQPDRRWFGKLYKLFLPLESCMITFVLINRKHSCYLADCPRSFPRVAQRAKE